MNISLSAFAPEKLVSLDGLYSSSTFYAQNPALEIVHQQKSVNVYLHIYNGNV